MPGCRPASLSVSFSSLPRSCRCSAAPTHDLLFTLLSAYIVAQSWDWLHGEAGYVNLGHYIYFGIGAYAFALANVNGLPVIVSFLVAALFTSLAAALLSFPLFRLRGDYFAFATLGAAAAVRALGDEPHGDHAAVPTASCCRPPRR